MKVAPLISTFSASRKKKESLDDFISKSIPNWNEDIVHTIAMTLHMETKDVTAYILAYYTALQDLMYFHLNVKTKWFEIITLNNISNASKRARVYKYRQYYKEPYFENRYECSVKARRHLIQIGTKGIEKIDVPVGFSVNEFKKQLEKEAVKKETKQAIRKREQNKKDYKKAKKKKRAIKKRKEKNWGWTKNV